jgi:hypothetical protein
MLAGWLRMRKQTGCFPPLVRRLPTSPKRISFRWPKIEKTVENLLSELSTVEMESQRLLDDESCRVVADAYSRGLLTDVEWARIKHLLRQALAFLSSPRKTSMDIIDGNIIIDPDADPRHADWLRIDAAHG